jgi:hypothetical protein
VVLSTSGEPIKNEDGSLKTEEISKIYCYAIVDLKHNYTVPQYEAATMRTVIHLTPISSPYYIKIGATNTFLSAEEYKNLPAETKKLY